MKMFKSPNSSDDERYHKKNVNGESDCRDKETAYEHDYGTNKSNNSHCNKTQFSLLSSPMRDYIDQISSSDAESGSEWLFKCVCESRDEYSEMICCDKCNCWQHIHCLGIDSQNIPSVFYCSDCQNNEINIPPPLIHRTSAQNENIKSGKFVIEKPSQMMSIQKVDSPLSLTINASDNNVTSCIVNENSRMIPALDENNYTNGNGCQCLKILKSFLNESRNYIKFQNEWEDQKNSHAFTLKNGVKILKLSKNLEKYQYICALEGEIHILNNKCNYINTHYDEFSHYIYQLKLTNEMTVIIDSRKATHFARSIRRSCLPNSEIKLAISNDSKGKIRMIMRTVELIEKHREITLAFDREPDFLAKLTNESVLQNSIKYEFVSTLICHCKQRLDFNSDMFCQISHSKKNINLGGVGNNNATNHNVNYHQRKKSPEVTKPTKSMKYSSDSSSEDSGVITTAAKYESAVGGGNMSREQKKLNYWVKKINEMEDDQNSKQQQQQQQQKSKRGRRPKQQPPPTSTNSVPATPVSGESLNMSIKNEPESIATTVDSLTNNEEKDGSEIIVNEAREYREREKKEGGWFMDDTTMNFMIENSDKMLNSLHDGPDITASKFRQKQLPLKLALQRGLYHMAFDTGAISPPLMGPISDYVNYRKKWLFELREEYLQNRSSVAANNIIKVGGPQQDDNRQNTAQLNTMMVPNESSPLNHENNINHQPQNGTWN